MLPTKIVELQLPTDIYPDQDEQLQRSVIHHLLIESKMTMASAMTLLSIDDLQWLVTAILQAAQESLFIACHIRDDVWSTKYWQRYSNQLGHLFIWYHRKEHLGEQVEVVSNYHGQLLSILRTIARRYVPQNLNSDQVELVQRYTLRLQDKQLNREDIFSITQTLQEHDLDTLLDLSPVADDLFNSYVKELGRG